MNWFEAVILGLLQGLTEFLPVSSSGHLEIAKSLFSVDPDATFYFTVAVHGATVLSTIVVFRKEIISLTGGLLKFRMNDETSYILKLIVSMIPVGLTGLLLKEPVEKLFTGNIVFVGLMLLITAVFLTTAHFIRKRDRGIGYTDALVIGIAQALAVIPGISRSGATISAGLIIGNKKEEVPRFSFLMVLVPVIGANLLEIFSSDAVKGPGNMFVILVGCITAFFSGYAACRWMINLVKRSKLIWFAIYCAAAGLLSVILG